jgi:hypothetical protein
VCQGALVLFRPTVQELLTIEQLFQRKLLSTQATIVYKKIQYISPIQKYVDAYISTTILLLLYYYGRMDKHVIQKP